jgi:NitT/TauT family transport system substrate-binding protein
MRRRKSLLAVVIFVLLLGACRDVEGGGDDAGGEEGGGTQQITLVTPNPSAIVVANFCAAQGEGYFEEEGLEVRFEAVDGSGAVLQALVAGQGEIGLPGPGPVLNARAQDEEPVMFYNHYAQALFGIVVPEDSDIESVEDLSGTTLGVGTVDGTEVTFSRAILDDAGLTFDEDYEILPVGDGGPATAAFERGEIDAYAAALPDMVIIESRGLPIEEITPEEYLDLFGNGFTAMQSYIDQNPDVIEGFTRAIVRGTEFSSENKEETLEHCAEINPEEASDQELVSDLFDFLVPRTEPVGGGTLGVYDAEAWQRWHDAMVDSGELEEPIDDIDSAYTNEFAEGASS